MAFSTDGLFSCDGAGGTAGQDRFRQIAPHSARVSGLGRRAQAAVHRTARSPRRRPSKFCVFVIALAIVIVLDRGPRLRLRVRISSGGDQQSTLRLAIPDRGLSCQAKNDGHPSQPCVQQITLQQSASPESASRRRSGGRRRPRPRRRRRQRSIASHGATVPPARLPAGRTAS